MIVIAVYNMKGGVGKSTTAVNLAYVAAQSGARTLLWDLDAQAASSFTFRVQPQVEGFKKESLRQIDTLSEAIKATDYDNLDLLPADFAYRKLDRFLEQLGRPDRDLAEVLQKLGREYTYVLLDCPPGLSTLSENVFFAADLILVPTIPTVLSLRTLSRLLEHVGGRGMGAKLTAFLSMVDRRKALHRHICDWALQHPEFFISAQVPYASIIEQMSVRRNPIAAVFPHDAAATAFDTLWCDVQARLAHSAPAAASGKAIDDLIAQIGGEAEVDRDAGLSRTPSQTATPVTAPADIQGTTHRLRLRVHSEHAFEALAPELSAMPSGSTCLSHIFDTEDGVLFSGGYLLELLEAPEGFAVAFETERNSEPVPQYEEGQVAAIDSCWAADILAGCLSPMTVLERRLKNPLPELLSAAVTAIGKRPLRRVTWRKRIRHQPGPILVPYGQAKVTMQFAFDRICGPGNEIEYEIEATLSGSSARNCEQALFQLFSRAGISWHPLTVRHLPPAANADNALVPQGEFVKTR